MTRMLRAAAHHAAGVLLLVFDAWATVASAQPGTVSSHQKISEIEGGFMGDLDAFDTFGWSLSSLGDLDGDGIEDLAVAAKTDDDGGLDRGAVWVLFLNVDGTVRAHQKISSTEGSFTGMLDAGDIFGNSASRLGDLDGDGIEDLAVAAAGDDDGGTNRGAVWVLFLNRDGTVRAHQKISSTEGGFAGTLDDNDQFGASLSRLGDLDGDGIEDLAVGMRLDGDGGPLRGAVWVLFLNSDGTVRAHQKISSTQGGFMGALDDSDEFGYVVSGVGDLDMDGVEDMAVGARSDDDGGTNRGAVWVLFLNADGTVRTHQKISDTEGNFTGTLDDLDAFGTSLSYLGDLNGDGIGDLVVGAWLDDDGGMNRGAVWVLLLNADGTVAAHQKISDTEGGFTGTLDDQDNFGRGAASIGDLDGNGVGDLAVGAPGDNPGDAVNQGAVWVLLLNGQPTDAVPGAMRSHLHQNVPNPFNPTTRIAFEVERADELDVSVFDVHGRKVKTLLSGRLQAGRHAVTWDGRTSRAERVAAGVYMVRLMSGATMLSRRMVLVE